MHMLTYVVSCVDPERLFRGGLFKLIGGGERIQRAMISPPANRHLCFFIDGTT